MKHGTKELLRTIISNQELMMKAMNIQPAKKEAPKKETDTKKAATKPVAKPAAKTAVKKAAKKALGK